MDSGALFGTETSGFIVSSDFGVSSGLISSSGYAAAYSGVASGGGTSGATSMKNSSSAGSCFVLVKLN